MSLGRADATSSRQHERLMERRSHVRSHIQRLEEAKIELSQERHTWLQWCYFHAGHLAHPHLLVLNFNRRPTLLGRILGHAFSVREAHVRQEDLESLRCILDLSFPREAIQGPHSQPHHCSREGANALGSQLTAAPFQASDCNSSSSSSSSSSSTSSPSPGQQGECRAPQAVVLVCGPQLSGFQELVLGTLFLKGKPAVVLAEGADGEACVDASHWTAGTWPVFSNQDDLIAYVDAELPRHLQLQKVIDQEMRALLEHHKRVSLANFTASRGPLLFVPFGLSIANSVGLFELCGRCMRESGVKADGPTLKSVADAVSNSSLEQVLKLPDKKGDGEGEGDVYHLLVKEAVLTEIVQAGPLAAAVAVLTHANVFLMGGVSVVTGVVSAVDRYLSYPQIVSSIADVVIMLMYTYSLNPRLRTPMLGKKALTSCAT